MKRDWYLIRNILVGIENNSMDSIQKYSQEQVEYHMCLLSNGAFIENYNGEYWLQWRGLELLDSLRNGQAFESALKLIAERGVGATEEILIALINEELKRKLDKRVKFGLSPENPDSSIPCFEEKADN